MVKAEKLLILNLSTTSGRLSPLQIISKTGIRPPSFGLVEMEPLGSIGELRFQESLPHDLLLEGIPLSGCCKVALRLEDGSISHAARGGQPLLEPHSVRGGSSQLQLHSSNWPPHKVQPVPASRRPGVLDRRPIYSGYFCLYSEKWRIPYAICILFRCYYSRWDFGWL